MRRCLLVLILTLAAGGGTLLLAPTAFAGTTIKYPQRAPAFTLEVPDGWRAEETTANLVHPLDFRPKKGRVDYFIQILYLSVADVSDRRGFVRELAGEQVKSSGMTGADYDAPLDEKLHSGLPVTGQVVRGKLGGVDYAYIFILFEVGKHGYVLAVNGPITALDEGSKLADKIAESIRPLKEK